MRVTGRVLVLVMCLFTVGPLLGKEKSAPHSGRVSKLKRPQINTVPREIPVEERGIGEIYTWPGYETQINLPSEVEIKQFGVGDGDLARWVVSCGQTPVADTGAKNVCHAKSGHPGQFTNLNVMTTDGTYSFELAPATSDHPIDLKVFVTRTHRTLIASNGAGGFAGGAAMVPKAELLACSELAHARQKEMQDQLYQANHKIGALIDPREVQYRDYEIKHSLFGRRPQATMFHTADRTYIRVPGHPAVYEETKSGKPAEVTAVCADGICMIPKVLDKGYFTTGIAQKRIKFERRKKEVHHG